MVKFNFWIVNNATFAIISKQYAHKTADNGKGIRLLRALYRHLIKLAALLNHSERLLDQGGEKILFSALLDWHFVINLSKTLAKEHPLEKICQRRIDVAILIVCKYSRFDPQFF